MLSNAVNQLELVEASTAFNPRQILATDALSRLNERSDWKGWVQLLGHLAVMGISGYLWASQWGNWLVALPALVVYGFTFASMFAALHECAHRTAFVNLQVNDAVCWLAGLFSLYNGTFYRRYHKWHHRFTQIPGKDPELGDPKPTNWREYLLELSGIPWWVGKVRTHVKVARGHVQDYPFLSEGSYDEVVRSTRLQLLVYGGAIALSVALGHPWAFFLYWVLPLAVGQPILRAILMSEHMGCTHDDNPLTNTRTTLTLFPVRFLMWNMPYHAEHHLYPSIPFHALAQAHEQLRPYFAHVEPGYVTVHRNLVTKFDQTAA
ncbi:MULTISPECIES: fatty acid desaturase [unclassified Leptolyngbya]|uniref:fatty acid desaturase n=1 Tax=unclassified Leptolyngbya TaxID=2650499 RepID=UPI001684B6E0|nr:fatty acid desaturase family protein [Leptolyngbya sp. FACHB-8]MBD2153223.1 fatty acid desaturase family protein [Leptolyngbya sp. FACHB-16]